MRYERQPAVHSPLTLDDGREKISYYLKRPYYGQLVVPGIWRALYDFSAVVCYCAWRANIMKK